MGTVALSNRTQLFVSSHLLLAANACSASLSPQSLAQGPKPTVSVLAHCCSTLWVQLHATQLHPSPRLSSLTLWVQLHATQLHPSPRLSSLTLWVQLHATQLHPSPRLSISVAAAPRHYIRLRLCWSYSARTRLLQCGATPKRQRSRDEWTLPSPTNQPPPSIHLVSAATRHRLSSHPRRFPSRL